LNNDYESETMKAMKSKTQSGHGGPRTGAGRPPRAEEPADVILSLRLTRTEHERYQRAATATEQPLAEWIRSSCDRASRRVRS
jgi:hypothetical protein